MESVGKRARRDLGLELEWQRRVESWRASGLSIRAFCLQNRLSESSFHSWKRELLRRHKESVRATSPLPTFVPMTVLPTTLAVEVRCSPARKIRVR